MTVNAYILWARGCLLMGAFDYSSTLHVRYDWQPNVQQSVIFAVHRCTVIVIVHQYRLYRVTVQLLYIQQLYISSIQHGPRSNNPIQFEFTSVFPA